MLIELFIERGGIDIYIGMSCLNSLYSLGSGYKTHETDICAASLLEHGDCIGGTAARCEHRVNNDNYSLADIRRELAVVFYGLVCIGIAIETDMTDLCHGNKLKNAVYHAETGAQYRNDRELFARDDLACHLCDGGFDFVVAQRQISRDLITHEHGNLIEKNAEIL